MHDVDVIIDIASGGHIGSLHQLMCTVIVQCVLGVAVNRGKQVSVVMLIFAHKKDAKKKKRKRKKAEN